MPRKPKPTWANVDDRDRPESDEMEIIMAAFRKMFADGVPVGGPGLGVTAGAEGIVRAVGVSVRVTSTPVLSVGGAAASGDYVGTSTTPQAFTNAVRVAGGTGVIKSLTITDKLTTAQSAMELWLFSATFTAPTDNAAWAISDADQLNCLGVIPIATDKWYANSNGQVFSNDALGLVIKPAARDLYYALVARGATPAWASGAGGSLQLSLGILQD